MLTVCQIILRVRVRLSIFPSQHECPAYPMATRALLTHTVLKSDPLRPKNQPVVLVGVTNVGTSAIYPIPSRPAPPAAHCRQGGNGRDATRRDATRRTRRDATPNLHRTRPQRSASPPAVASAHRMVLAAWYVLHVACQHLLIALYTTQLPFVVFRWCRQVDVPQ